MELIEFLESLPEKANTVDRLVLMVMIKKPHMKNKELAKLLNISERTVYRAKNSLEEYGIDTKYNFISGKENLDFSIPKDVNFASEKKKEKKQLEEGQFIPYDILFETIISLEKSENILGNINPKRRNITIVKNRIATITLLLKGHMIFSIMSKYFKSKGIK